MASAKLLSTVTLVLTSMFMLGVAGGLLSGGIFDLSGSSLPRRVFTPVLCGNK